MSKTKKAAIVIGIVLAVLAVLTVLLVSGVLIIGNIIFPDPSKDFDYSGWKKATLKNDCEIMIPLDWSVETDSGICYVLNKDGDPEMINTFLSDKEYDHDHPNRLSNRFYPEYEIEDYSNISYEYHFVEYGKGKIKTSAEEKELFMICYDDLCFIVWDEDIPEETVKKLTWGYYHKT